MLRYIMLLMLIAALMVWISPPAVAGQIPTRGHISKTDASVTAVKVEAFQNCTLEQVNIWNCKPTNAVMNVKHVYTLGTTTVTNTLTSITGNTSGKGSATYTNVYLLPSDYLLFYFSSAATGLVDYVRLVN